MVMITWTRRAAKRIGLKPGTLVHVGEQKVERLSVNVIDYTATELTEKTLASVDDCLPFRDTPTLTWVNVNGVHDVGEIAKLGQHFGVHELVLEDIVNTRHRPKLEESDTYVFVILKMLSLQESDSELESEQVSIIFSKNAVISFQEREGDVLNPIRNRIRKTVPRVRFMGGDYLGYAIMDTIVDHYFVILERLGERIEELEDELIAQPTPEKLEGIYALKRELIAMRKAVWPLREVVGGLDRLESPLIRDSIRVYIRDLYEHVIQVIDSVETLRETVSGLLDMYMTSVSNRMNEVMKVLTIIATIFITLGFIAGVYGMNFDTEASPVNMPELGLPYGYLLFWGVAVLIAVGLFVFFRRKRWL
jgi:magnesium transporter